VKNLAHSRLPVAKNICLGLAFGPKYVEGYVVGWLERIGEDDPDEEAFLQDLWEEGEVFIKRTSYAVFSSRPWYP